jgi:hypothetical protein
MDQEISSASESVSQKTTTNNSLSKPIREAKKRSLIYTGNTREFLETAIAAGIIPDNGDEEDEDNEYVPPGGTVTIRAQCSSSSENEDESAKSSDDSDDDDNEEEENNSDDDENEKNSGDEMVLNEEPSESGINWNVRSRPHRHTHLIRFDNMSKEDGNTVAYLFFYLKYSFFKEQQFFGALQEQVPALAAYLDDNSDEEYQIDTKETTDSQPKSSRKSSTKKSQRNQIKENSEQDEETVEIIKKFRHVNVPSERRTKRKSHPNESTTISTKNRSDELYVMLNENLPRTILSGAHLDTAGNTKKNPTIQSFHFHRRQVKMNAVEDLKAQWRCILCWKEPYEQYLGPLYGPFQLNEQCRLYFNNS